MGQSPSSTNYTNNPEDHVLVQGNADMSCGWVVPRVWTTEITKLAHSNDLIFSVRAPVGDIGKTRYPVVLGRGVAAIRGTEFIFQALYAMKQNKVWDATSAGSTFKAISGRDLVAQSIRVPSENEQQQIGGLLERLDHLITLHQRKAYSSLNLWPSIPLLRIR